MLMPLAVLEEDLGKQITRGWHAATDIATYTLNPPRPTYFLPHAWTFTSAFFLFLFTLLLCLSSLVRPYALGRHWLANAEFNLLDTA